MSKKTIKPINISEINNIDISDEFCKNELIEYFNELIIKHRRSLKKDSFAVIYQEDFIRFPDEDIVECVIDLFYSNGFGIYFFDDFPNRRSLRITKSPNDIFEEFYEMDFSAMKGKFVSKKHIYKNPGDWGIKREWIDRVAINEFGHEGLPHRVINLSETGFDIIKLEVPDAPHRSSAKKKWLFNIFN